MENIIKLTRCVTDFDKLDDSDLKNGVEIRVWSDVHDLLIYSDAKDEMERDTIFGLWVECGEKTIMLNPSINELELFASSVLKHIEIIRKNYGEQIKIQSDMGMHV